MNAVRLDDIKKIKGNIDLKKIDGCTFLVTGATGFMGAFLVDTLMCCGNCRVIAMLRNLKKGEKLFKEWMGNSNFSIYENDIRESFDLKNEKRIDYVFHTAGSASSIVSKEHPVEVLTSNVVGTYNILEYAKKNDVRGVLLFSSGAANLINTEKENPNAYATAKLSVEQMGEAYRREYGMSIKSVRISHTYGPGIDLNDGHIYSDIVKAFVNKREMIVINPNAVRPYCYITDAINAFFKILFSEENGIFQMANYYQLFSVEELCSRLNKAYGLSVSFVNEPKGKEDVCAERLRDSRLIELGWEPVINVEEGFERTVKSYMDK